MSWSSLKMGELDKSRFGSAVGFRSVNSRVGGIDKSMLAFKNLGKVTRELEHSSK